MGRPRKNPAAPVISSKKISSFEGLSDIITEVDMGWDGILKLLGKTARVYGFNRIEVPLVEDAGLYARFNTASAAGVSEQPVSCEVAGRAANVRSSLLPGVLRAYAQHKIFEKSPLSKWLYVGNTMKVDAKGKAVGDWEFGLEVFGAFTHLTEAQVIGAVWDFLFSLGLKDIVLEINHIGETSCQVAYEETLGEYLSGKKYELCDDCNAHLKGRVLNVFRCQNIDCQALLSEAPTILDFLDEGSHKHFTSILEALDELGIPYQLNPLYAGVEGVSKTNVVIKHKTKGQTEILGEGGYHDSLIAQLGGKNWCCFGFNGSLQKIYEALDAAKITLAREQRNEVFLVPLGELAAKKSLRLFRDLVGERVSVYDHFGNSGVKNQLKQAEEYKAPIALIMGQKEALDEVVILRDVKSGMQEIISYDKIVDEVKKRLGK
jgi:histidyl-tRNA synthetase